MPVTVFKWWYFPCSLPSNATRSRRLILWNGDGSFLEDDAMSQPCSRHSRTLPKMSSGLQSEHTSQDNGNSWVVQVCVRHHTQQMALPLLRECRWVGSLAVPQRCSSLLSNKCPKQTLQSLLQTCRSTTKPGDIFVCVSAIVQDG